MDTQTELELSVSNNNLNLEQVINGKAVTSQCGKLLFFFSSRPNQWIPLPEILALGIAQYNTRILELRRAGYEIRNRIVEVVNKQKHTAFMYVPKAG